MIYIKQKKKSYIRIKNLIFFIRNGFEKSIFVETLKIENVRHSKPFKFFDKAPIKERNQTYVLNNISQKK